MRVLCIVILLTTSSVCSAQFSVLHTTVQYRPLNPINTNSVLESTLSIEADEVLSDSLRTVASASSTPRAENAVQPDSGSKIAQSSGTVLKSPTGAVLRSLACPGWGQLYNESHIKSALFFGAAVTVSTIIVWNQERYTTAANEYDGLTDADPKKQTRFREKEFYRDQRDQAGLYLLLTYAVAAIDAYVGAHLFDFDVSDKGVTLHGGVMNNNFALRLNYNF